MTTRISLGSFALAGPAIPGMSTPGPLEIRIRGLVYEVREDLVLREQLKA
jgi:hypothetical protein